LANALDTDLETLTACKEESSSEDSRKLITIFHALPLLGSFLPSGNILAPVLFWLYKKDNKELDAHGKAVINFQLTMSIALIAAILSMFFVFPPIGMFMMFCSIIYNMVVVVVNTLKVSKGQKYSYPVSIKFLRNPSLVVAGLAFLIMLSNFESQAQNIKRLDGTSIKAANLQKHIKRLMEAGKVTGLGVTIFNQNKVVYKEAFGTKDIVTNQPLRGVTNIYGASLSKAVFSVLVMKLVEDGVIDLDKPLQEYLPKRIYEYSPQKKWQDNYSDLKEDTLYKKITARMCLSHTTGLPNWRWDNPDQKLKIMFQPGSRYSYSGEGMVYLQTVIEKIIGKPLELLVREIIFDPAAMKNSAYTWLPRFEEDYAVGHNKEGQRYEKDKDNEPRAPSTLETTLDDYALFTEAVLKKTIINQTSSDEMFKPQLRLRSLKQMGPQSNTQTTENDGIILSYGLGWGLLKSPYGWGAFKEGHGNGFQHYSIIFPSSGTGIVIMTNSDNGESIFKELLEITIADKYTPWKWQQYIPYNYKEN
jgi:CubicO group peptidase (beta-lactamase class C family)/uncharacterized Tic20 family protein